MIGPEELTPPVSAKTVVQLPLTPQEGLGILQVPTPGVPLATQVPVIAAPPLELGMDVAAQAAAWITLRGLCWA